MFDAKMCTALFHSSFSEQFQHSRESFPTFALKIESAKNIHFQDVLSRTSLSAAFTPYAPRALSLECFFKIIEYAS